MWLRTTFRFLLWIFVVIIGLTVGLVVVSVAPVDRTPVSELPVYDSMQSRLSSLNVRLPSATAPLKAGWSRVNITPSSPVATAGYGSRKGQTYRAVHDSIFVRTIVLDNGAERVAIVSGDLLLIPPAVISVLPDKLRATGFSLGNTFLGATHSHNSIGHWSGGAMTLLYGDYQDSVVHFIADAIVRSIALASSSLRPARLSTGAIAAPGPVRNRLTDDGFEDPYLRVLEVRRDDGSQGVLTTYAAHATCSSQKTIELSRDYPGEFVDALEEGGYSFAMFMAGAVGSHTTDASSKDWSCMAWMGEQLAAVLFEHRHTLSTLEDNTLAMVRVPLALSDPQVKLSKDWKIRSWLFRNAIGEYPVHLTALRVGHLVMLGAPCDFSGYFHAPIDSAAQALGMQAMITSFNGGYIGYITPQKYYDLDHYETQLMNWYAPGTGEYIAESMEQLMRVLSDAR
jgi:neutral ceramidase